MVYYELKEISQPPYIKWDVVARGEEEFNYLGLKLGKTKEGNLITTKKPEFKFGVAVNHLDGTQRDLKKFIPEFYQKKYIEKSLKIDHQKDEFLKNQTFEYKGESFPLGKDLVEFYNQLKDADSEVFISTVNHEIFELKKSYIKDFIKTCNKKVIEINNQLMLKKKELKDMMDKEMKEELKKYR